MPPRSLLLDTTVLIYLLNRPRIRTTAEYLRRLGRYWLSSVVLAELYAGTRSREDRTRLDDLVGPIADDRVVLPRHEDWVHAGQLIARRARLTGDVHPRDHLNDVLILLSAARHNAAVVMANVRHFQQWARQAAAGGIVVDVVPFPSDN